MGWIDQVSGIVVPAFGKMPFDVLSFERHL